MTHPLLRPQPMTPTQVADLVERVRAAGEHYGDECPTPRNGRGRAAAILSHDTGKSLRLAAVESGCSFSAATSAWYDLYGKTRWPGWRGQGWRRGEVGVRPKPPPQRKPRIVRPRATAVEDAVAESATLCREARCGRIEAHRVGECDGRRAARR